MEKLTKALQAAKDKIGHDEVEEVSVDTESTEPVDPNKDAANVVNIGRMQSNDEIVYTETKKLNLDFDKIKQQKIISIATAGKIENAYKVLRTQVVQRLRLNNWNAFGVVSSRSNEGKSLTAINLAISIAQEIQHTVLLVDFDLQNPSLHTFFNFHPEAGISDYLLYDKPLNEILINPGIDGLVMLPGREALINSSEALSSPKAIELVNELKTRYPKRIVVFDLPALLDTDDVIAFSPYIDAVLMVIEDGKSSQEDLQRSMDYLKKVNFLGSVLNKSGAKVTLK